MISKHRNASESLYPCAQKIKHRDKQHIYFTLTFAYMIYRNLSERNVYSAVTRLLYISYLCDGVWVELITGFGIFLWPLSLCITSKRLILGNQAYKKKNIKKYSVSCLDQQIFIMYHLWLITLSLAAVATTLRFGSWSYATDSQPKCSQYSWTKCRLSLFIESNE